MKNEALTPGGQPEEEARSRRRKRDKRSRRGLPLDEGATPLRGPGRNSRTPRNLKRYAALLIAALLALTPALPPSEDAVLGCRGSIPPSKPRSSAPPLLAPTPVSHAPSNRRRTPRQYNERGNRSSNYDSSPSGGIDSGKSSRKGRPLPPLRGGHDLSSTPGRGRAGPKSPSAYSPADARPLWEGFPLKKGPISRMFSSNIRKIL
jgi:hypothetical protein